MEITNINLIGNQRLTFQVNGDNCLHTLDYPFNNPFNWDKKFEDLSNDQVKQLLIEDFGSFYDNTYLEIFKEDYNIWQASKLASREILGDVFKSLGDILNPNGNAQI